eukprot:g15891.t1
MVGCVVCFSPIGDNWRTRLRQFPSLVNCCTIDWYTAWPPDALMAVATKFLEAIPDLDNEVRQNCVEMCQYFHLSSKKLAVRFEDELKRIYYSTPTSFLELIQTFKSLLGEKRDSISSLKSKYEVGLEKLTTTEQSVGEMMIVVNEESAKTEKVKEVVAADEAVASKAAAEADGIKKDTDSPFMPSQECEEALAEAMPALNEALKALDTLSSKEIAEVKAMKNPAAPVRLVLSAVCVLRNVKPVRVKDESGKMVDDFWPAAVKMISDMGFLQSLQTFDKDNIPPATIKKIAEYTVKEDFQPDRVTASGFARICQWNICFAEVQKSSTAAWGLCMWVRAMETYDRVAKVVAPKKDSLAEAEAAYQGVMGKLQEKRAELQKVMDELTALNEKLSSLRQEQDNLTNEVDLCQKKLERAETLITSLGGEKTRWTQNAIDLAADYVNLTGDVIVASGLIAYLGAFTPDFRESAVREWAGESRERAIPGSEKFSLEHCLGEPVKVRAWVVAGLPNDSFSIENGIIMDKARRWPLCIDPQGQANRWIKKMGQPLQLVVAKFTDGDYLKRLEGCIQFGNPMLIENGTRRLGPVLSRRLFSLFHPYATSDQIHRRGGTSLAGRPEVQYREAPIITADLLPQPINLQKFRDLVNTDRSTTLKWGQGKVLFCDGLGGTASSAVLLAEGCVVCWQATEAQRRLLLEKAASCPETRGRRFRSLGEARESFGSPRSPAVSSETLDLGEAAPGQKTHMSSNGKLALSIDPEDSLVHRNHSPVLPRSQIVGVGLGTGPHVPLTGRYEHMIHKLRYELNAEAGLLDSPDLLWENATAEKLHDKVVAHFDVRRRTEVLNQRLSLGPEPGGLSPRMKLRRPLRSYSLDYLHTLGEHVRHLHSVRLERMIIILITLELGVGIMGLSPNLASWPSLVLAQHGLF